MHPSRILDFGFWILDFGLRVRGCFKSIRRFKPLLQKQSPPAWTI